MSSAADSKVLKTNRLAGSQLKAFFSMSLLYLFYYFCKYNFGVGVPGLREEFGYSKAEIGIAGTVFALVYAAGQFVNGYLGDRYGPKRMMIIGGFGGVIASVLFGLGTGLVFFIVFWGINAYFSSCGWAPGSRILFNWFPEKKWGTWMGIYNALCYTGGAIVSIVAGFAVSYWGSWRAAFFVPPIFLLTMTLIFWWVNKSSPEEAGLTTEWEPPHAKITHKRVGAAEYWTAFSNPQMALVYVSGFGANVIRYAIIYWLVDMLAAPIVADKVGEAGFGVHIAIAGIVASMAHWGGAFFSLVLGWMSDRIFKSMRWQTILIGFVVGALPLFWIGMGPGAFSSEVMFEYQVEAAAEPATTTAAVTDTAQANGRRIVVNEDGQRMEVVEVTVGWVVIAAMVFVSGGLIQAVQTPLFDLPGDILGKELGGTGVGILDGWMYVGAAVAGVAVGALFDRVGVTGLYVMAVISIVSGLVIIPLKK